MATARTATAVAIFLLLMDRAAVTLEKVPVPGDCSPTPFRRTTDEYDEDAAAAAMTSDPPPVAGGGGLHLTCLLSAINSEAERTNFSVIPAEETVGLTVRCADEVVRSQLEPGGFSSLVWLEELRLDRCSLDRVPARAFLGLARLRKLQV
jgi:hypothetical protein